MALSFGQVLHSSAFTIKEYLEAGQSEHFPFVFWDYPGIHLYLLIKINIYLWMLKFLILYNIDPDNESAPYNLAALPATMVFYILG